MGPVTVTPEPRDDHGHSHWEIVSASAVSDSEGNYELRVTRGSGGLRVQVNDVRETLHVDGEDEYTLDIEVPAGG